MKMMKAVRVHAYGGSEAAVYEDALIPEVGDGEVLIRVQAVSVNPVDWKTRRGYLSGVFSLPGTLGWDAAGIVEATGESVTHVAPGDAVYAMIFLRGGAFAEYAVAKAEEVAKAPSSLSMIDSAGVPLGALTAMQALQQSQLQSGQRILIHAAAGGVGIFAVQLAKLAGAQVIATASAHNHAFVRALGADTVIDYRAVRFEQSAQDVDVVLDGVGGDILQRSWAVLRAGGLLVSIVDQIDPDTIPADKRGIRVGVQPNAEQLTQIARMLDAGVLKTMTTLVLSLSDARLALDLSETGRVRGKLVLQVE